MECCAGSIHPEDVTVNTRISAPWLWATFVLVGYKRGPAILWGGVAAVGCFYWLRVVTWECPAVCSREKPVPRKPVNKACLLCLQFHTSSSSSLSHRHLSRGTQPTQTLSVLSHGHCLCYVFHEIGFHQIATWFTSFLSVQSLLQRSSLQRDITRPLCPK